MNEEVVEFIENLHLIGFDVRGIKLKIEKKFGRAFQREEIIEITNAYDDQLRKEEPDDELERIRAIKRLETIYMKSFAIQDFKTCLGIQKEIDRLRGLLNTDTQSDYF